MKVICLIFQVNTEIKNYIISNYCIFIAIKMVVNMYLIFYYCKLFELTDEEDHLEYNMPWLGVMTKLLRSFNYHCTHQNFCHPQCYKRQMRAAKRIMEATRHVRNSTT